jgi:hypothetical protein
MRLQLISAQHRARRMVTKIAREIIIAGLCWIALGQKPNADEVPSISPEYVIKAAYIYNFAMFVEWPDKAFRRESSPIVIGIVGTDPFGAAIDQTVRDKKIDKRPLVVKRLQWDQEFEYCHILFITSSEKARFAELVQRVKNLPILVVTESPGFAERGSIINFIVEQNRVRCEINVDAAKRAHLNISSKLLGLAKVTSGA